MQEDKEPSVLSELAEEWVTAAVVFRAPVSEVEKALAGLRRLLGDQIVFKRISLGRLYITDKDPREGPR